ncbi:MAG: extracellular solute-binding protein [Caldilineaceae bacterium]
MRIKIAQILTILLFAPLLLSTVSQVTNARSANPAVHTAPSIQTDEPITIRWRTRWDETRVRRVALPAIRLFQAQHPDIRVELENVASNSEYDAQLRAELAAGDGPDVFYPATPMAYELHLQNQLLPLAELIAADAIDLSAYDTDALALYAQDGQPYCLPADVAALAVIYNQKLFAHADVAAPPDQWTWDDFRITAQALTVDRGGEEDRQFGVDDSTRTGRCCCGARLATMCLTTRIAA